MDPADDLLNKIYSLVDLEAQSADELNKLATELEEQRKDVNISKVAGSAVSVAGSAAVLTAGLLTGGAAVPVLAAGGAVATWLGLGVSVGSEVVDGINPEKDEKEKQIYKEIEVLTDKIGKLTESLADEGRKAGISEDAQEEYVTERILRAMAKRYGLTLDTKVSIYKLLSKSSKMNSTIASCTFRLIGSLECFLIYKFIYNILKLQAGSKAAFKAVRSSVASAASRQAVKAAGSKVSGKALKYVTKGACGLVFSSAELIYNCVTLDQCETDKSKSLKKRAEEMKTHAESTKKELDAIRHMFEELPEVKSSIENGKRGSQQKKPLIDFAKEQCEDEAVRTWLEENENSGAFLELIDMFCFLHEELNKQGEKIDRENIDIIFVAHGSIENPLIPASSLLPLSTIQDVILYSPWNCALTAVAVYGIATGRLKPEHREFFCRDKENCVTPDREHQPADLPNHWNSMQKAEKQMIPTISVSPLRPEDGAWDSFVLLQSICGQPGKNRVLIPFILPGVDKDFEVPFFVVTLALSLVLYFSSSKATIHLTACLGKSVPTVYLPKHDLNDQYSYTIDKTGMTSSEEMLIETFLSGLLKKLFK